MPEHDHLHEHNHTKHDHDESCEHFFVPARLLAGSIVVAALIVGGSIMYGAKLMSKTVVGNGISSSSSSPTAKPSEQQAPAQAPLAKPTGPVDITSRADEPTLGNKNAKVTIVEFADFQCPFCKQYFDQTFNQIKTKYIDTGKVKYVYRHFPLSFHANAEIAGVAAECANQQGKFWEYHDTLFAKGQGDGTGLASADLKKYAEDLGLNKGTLGFAKNKFNQCLDNKATLDIVKKDNAEGAKGGVSGTPSFFINGQLLVGAQPFSAFEQAIEAMLK